MRPTDRTELKILPKSKIRSKSEIRNLNSKILNFQNSKIPKSEIRNSENPKVWNIKIQFVQKIISSSSPSQCVQAHQPWASTWIVQIRSPCAPYTLIYSNGFWIWLYTPGSWLVLPMWDISYFWFSFLPKLPTHITLHPNFRFPNFQFLKSEFRIYI